jgi:hypothetical protein
MGQYTALAYGQTWSKKQIYPQKPFDLKIQNCNNSSSKKEKNNKWLAYLQSKLK